MKENKIFHVRRIAALGGHEPGKPELCFPGEIGGGHYNPTGDPHTPTDLNDPPEDFFRLPSGVIWEQPEVQGMIETSRKPK
jgi:hypothetical protein